MTAGAALGYFLGHGQESCYFNDLVQPGRWAGNAAAQLDLPPTVTRAVFHHLLQGFSPDGRRPFVQNAGDPRRDACWDLTFSAPKSVSVLWALAPETTRKQIEQAHNEAVLQTLQYVELVAGLTRRGKGGAIKEHADVLLATFFHGASRSQDPALHTHAVLINLGLRQDGTTGALRTLEVFQCKMRAGALYRRTLAQRLTQRLDLTLDPEQVGFHVRGVPKALCHAFSKRSRAIRKLMQERGLTGAVAAKEVTLLTRPKKERLSPREFFARCAAKAQKLGWGQSQTHELLERCRRGLGAAETQPLEETKARVTERGRDTAAPGQDRSRSLGPEAATEKSTRDQARQAHQAHEGGPAAENSDRRQKDDRGQTKQDRASTQEARPERPGGEAHGRAPDPDDLQMPPADPEAARYSIRLEWRRLFPKAPFWSPAKSVKVPTVVFPESQPRWGDWLWRRNLGFAELRGQRRRLFPDAPQWSPLQGFERRALRVVRPAWSIPDPARPKWWRMRWKANLGFAELRVQDRNLFRHAPKWSWFYGWKIRALRLTREKSKWTRAQPTAWPKQHAQQNQRMHQAH
jgi:conjugative relaxase-like TrwC/TraI family protein